MIRTIKKLIDNKLRANKNKIWVEMLRPPLNKYNIQIHSSRDIIPNRAYNLNNAIEVKIMLIMKNKNNRKYSNINEGDYVKIFAKGKGNYILRKETRN